MKHKIRDFENYHFVIEGQRFLNFGRMLNEAQKRGFTGTDALFVYRVRRGPVTWAALLAPVSETRSAAGYASQQRKRDEMAAVIAALDARKAGLA